MIFTYWTDLDCRISKASEGCVAFLAAVGLYLPFLSGHYEQNGVAEARSLEHGTLFSANHLLYRPLGLLVQDLLSSFGFQIRSIFVLQTVTAVCGAASIAFAYLFFRRITHSRFVAAAIGLWLATSWAYWTFSTDAIYIPVAAMFVTAALATFVSGDSRIFLLVTGCFAGFAILVWQANIFLIAVFLIGLVLVKPASPGKQLRRGLWLVAACVFPVAIMYFLAALSKGVLTPALFLRWVTSHGDGAGLPIWGRFGWERVGQAGRVAVESVVPLGSAAGVVAFAVLLLASAWTVKHWLFRANGQELRTTAWLAASYLVYLPFIIWFDLAKEWFVITNIFLGGLLAHALGGIRHRRYLRRVLAAAVFTVAAVNFSSTIWPQATVPNPNLELAKCVASHMQPSDVVVAADWNWTDYTGYFFNRTSISLLGEVARDGDPEIALRNIRRQILKTQWLNGDVYFPDPASYPPSYLAWLQSNIGVTLEDFAALKAEPAFDCGGKTFLRAPRLSLEGKPVFRMPTEELSLELLPAGGARVSTAGVATARSVGYAQIVADDGSLPTGFVIFESYSGDSLETEALFPLAPAITSGRLAVDIEPGIRTAIAFTNPNGKSSRVDFLFRDSDGSPLRDGFMEVPPRAHLSRFLTEEPFYAGSPLAGTLTFNSTVPISVLGLRVEDKASRPVFSRIVVSGAHVQDRKRRLIPYFITGGGWVSHVVLMNPTYRELRGQLEYAFADSPASAQAETEEMEYTIPPQGVRRLVLPGSSGSRTGYAVLRSADDADAPFASVLLLREDGSVPADHASMEAVAPGPVQTLYVERNDESVATRVVVVNFSDRPTTVRMDLTNLDATPAGLVRSLILPARGVWSATLHEMENARLLPKSFRGILRIQSESGPEITGVSVRYRNEGSKQDIMSLMPSVEALAPPTRESMVFPHIVDSGGYISRFVLLNKSESISTLALRFLSSSGKPMRLLVH